MIGPNEDHDRAEVFDHDPAKQSEAKYILKLYGRKYRFGKKDRWVNEKKGTSDERKIC